MTDSDSSSSSSPRPPGQNSTLVLLLLVVVAVGAVGFAILGFTQRGQAESALEMARTEAVVREQAAFATADVEAQNADQAAATAVAALNIANSANNAAVTEAANARFADSTAAAMSTLAAESDLAAGEAQGAAATANALAVTADANAALADAKAATADSIAVTANANLEAIRNHVETAEAGATAAGRVMFVATAAYSTSVARATDVGNARSTAQILAIQGANLRATLTLVSFQVQRLSGTATPLAATAEAAGSLALAQEPTVSPRPSNDPTGTPAVSSGGLAFVGENSGLVPANGIEGWLYVGLEGETITITAEADFDIIISLFDGEDNLMALGENNGRENYNRIENITLPTTDSYVIIVSGFLRMSDGPYTLTIESDERAGSSLSSQPTPSPTITATSSLRLSETGLALVGENTGEVLEGGTEVWLYRGRAGETLTITTEADWDTTLMLFDEDVEMLASNDDIIPFENSQSQIEYTLRETGTYFISVGSFRNRSGGPYKLIIESERQGF